MDIEIGSRSLINFVHYQRVTYTLSQDEYEFASNLPDPALKRFVNQAVPYKEESESQSRIIYRIRSSKGPNASFETAIREKFPINTIQRL